MLREERTLETFGAGSSYNIKKELETLLGQPCSTQVTSQNHFLSVKSESHVLRIACYIILPEISSSKMIFLQPISSFRHSLPQKTKSAT